MIFRATIFVIVVISTEGATDTRSATIMSNYFKTSRQNRFGLDILPEYTLERHTFPTPVRPDSVDQFEDTVLYRLPAGPKSPANPDKPPMLIQHGVMCDTNRCATNHALVAMAYLMVDQGQDVWLERSNFTEEKHPMKSDDFDRNHLTRVSQYVLSVTNQPELSVLGLFNGTTMLFAVKVAPEKIQEQSTLSKWFNYIPGVATAKKWYAQGRDFVTRSYDKVMESIDYLGKKVDVVIDDFFIRKIKAKVLRSWGIVTDMLLPTFTIDDFSKTINHPDVFLSTIELVRKYGYDGEEHEIVTEDGYVLTVHRISGGPVHPPRRGKPVIILQHGILCSSADWIITGPSKALGYRLSDEGYDVWMSNSRGNTYSRRHVNRTTSQSEFWDFSWHEMGVYDMPAVIDYVLRTTEVDSVSFVGHSQGGTQFLVLLSEKPEYNSKISSAAVFAPVAYASHMKSPISSVFAKIGTPLYYFLRSMGVNSFLHTNDFLTQLGRDACESKSVLQVICSNTLFLITGYDSRQMNFTTVPIIMGHVPTGASIKQFVHFGQLHNSKKFRQFDYSFTYANKRKYGQNEPPEYNLTNARVPLAIFYANNDLLADDKDVERLADEYPNLAMKHKVAYENFNHIDFLYAMDAPKLVYQRLIDYLRRDDENAIE